MVTLVVVLMAVVSLSVMSLQLICVMALMAVIVVIVGSFHIGGNCDCGSCHRNNLWLTLEEEGFMMRSFVSRSVMTNVMAGVMADVMAGVMASLMTNVVAGVMRVVVVGMVVMMMDTHIMADNVSMRMIDFVVPGNTRSILGCIAEETLVDDFGVG
jgi:hypothetical protein